MPQSKEDVEEALKGKSPEERRKFFETKAFVGLLAAGPYFPRTTCATAAHFMSQGRIMQIGCSQGKTSVVAMATYEQLMMGKKVFSTSSSPGLVPENYNEAREFYEIMGVAEDFCAISQNETDKVDHIVLFHNKKKYEIRADGKILVEEKDANGKPNMVETQLTADELKKLGLDGIGVGEDGKTAIYDFEKSVAKMLKEKGIIMGDTITLGKYQHLFPDKKDGVIENSYLIVDEADAELLDTHPQEITGKEYPEEEAQKRKEMRQRAFRLIEIYDGSTSLEQLASDNDLPLDFLMDALEAREDYGSPEKYTVKNGKIYVLNPETSIMVPASQGVAQAIIASDPELEGYDIKELEVTGEVDIPKLFSNFEIASLMSGTMEDKGISEMDEDSRKNYNGALQVFLSKCGTGIRKSFRDGIKVMKLVTPKTRKERGEAIVTKNGINREKRDDSDTEISTAAEGAVIPDWRTYIEQNGAELDEQWRLAVQEEASIRSAGGQPVMVSVYGDRNPMVNAQGQPLCEVYTDTRQVGDDHKFGDDKCLFSHITRNADGSIARREGEVACFDDSYGRGYTFKFVDRDENGIVTKVKNGETKPVKFKGGGHVLITSLPQNSRNLEQFLFRVARGGDNGSSSMIISPNDPVIINYLERLEKEKGPEAANKYFQDIMQGKIPVMQIIRDIYPQKSIEIFTRKTNILKTRDLYQQRRANDIIGLDAVNQALGLDAETRKSMAEEYGKAYGQEMAKREKLFRRKGVDPKTENYDKVTISAVSKMIKKAQKKGKTLMPEQIVALLPPGLTEEQLAQMIPDENLRGQVIAISQRVDQFIESKKNPQKGIETRDTGKETEEAGREDAEYNLSAAELAIAQLREQREQAKDMSEKENEQE